MDKYGVDVSDKPGFTKEAAETGRCPSCGAELTSSNPPSCPDCGTRPFEQEKPSGEENPKRPNR